MKRQYSLSSGLGRVAPLLAQLRWEVDGATAIEFATVANALILFLLGVLEFGRAYWTQSELQYAVEAAARYATVYIFNNPSATTTQIQTAVQNQAATYVNAGSVSASDFTVTPYNSTAIPPTPSCGNQVTVSYPFSFMVPALFPFSVTLTATGCNLN